MGGDSVGVDKVVRGETVGGRASAREGGAMREVLPDSQAYEEIAIWKG